MKRREFFGIAGGAVAGVAASGLAAPAIAQERIEWNMVMPWPKNAPGVGVNATRFAERVTQMSGGRLTIKVHGGGELVPPFESMDAVQQGVVQVAHATPYYWSGKSSALNYFTTVPFGLTASELSGWIYYGGGQELWEEAYEPFGIQPFYAGSSGLQAGGWFNKEINSVDDLRGLKMRIAGIGGAAMNKLGANVTMIPPGEIFPAMSSGAIDAAEWVGPWNDLAFGLYKVAEYYYLPAFHEPGPGLEVIVSKSAYAALPEDLQAIVRYAAQSIAEATLADFTYHNVVSLDPLLERGVKLRSFNEEVVGALGKASLEALEELGSASELNAKVHKAYMTYARQCARYTSQMEQVMLAQRAQVLGG